MKYNYILIIALILCASLLRFVPHPPNMTPLIAISMMTVICFDKRSLQIGIPICIMIITDFFIGYHKLVPIVYASIVLAGLAGYIFKQKQTFINMFGASLLASIIFFVASNFGVWALGSMYQKTLLGLVQCYIAAIPFFHNTVISTVVIACSMFVLTEKIPFGQSKSISTEH